MAFGFNPFTGNFDLTGGGDAAPFAGQVDAYADLPLDSTAALNSRWLVKNNSGTWPFSTYKQAGIYIRVSTVGASRDTDYQFVGTLPSVMNDSEFLIYDNVDATRNLKFDVGTNVPTGTTRTLTVPNASGRIQVEGQPIGNVTASTGAFTTLSASDALTASNATASPPTTLAATKGVQWSLPASSSAAIAGIYPGGAGISLLTGNPGGMTEHARFGGGSSTITFNSPLTAAAGSFTTLTATTSGSAGSPSLNLGSNSGLYDGSPTTLRLAVNGTQLVSFFGGVSNNRGIVIRDDVGEFQIGSGSIDVRLGRDAANTLSLKNTTNPQTFNIYNTFTSATNHERGFLKWSSNVFQIGTEAGSGGGTVRNVDIRVGTQSSGAVFSAAGSGMQLSLRNVTTTSTSSLAGITLGSGHDIVLSTTTGTKIGTATNQLLGFFNAAPVAQQAAVADATDAASTQARLNDLLARLRTLGLIAT